MHKPAMHEHVRDKLVWLKIDRSRIKQGQVPDHGVN